MQESKKEKESKTRKSVRKKINISITDEAVGDISKKSASKVVLPKREISWEKKIEAEFHFFFICDKEWFYMLFFDDNVRCEM